MDIKEYKQKIIIAVVRYNGLISLVLALIILIGGYFLVIGPFYSQTKQKYLDSKTYNESLYNGKKAALDKLASILNDFNNIKDIDKQKIDKILPSNRDHIDLFPEIEYLTLRNGLLFNSVGITEISDVSSVVAVEDASKAKLKNIGAFLISISVSGADYQNFKKYLASLEENLRLMDVIRLSYDPKSKAASLEILTYFWKDQ